MQNKKLKPILKWAGGKTQLLADISHACPAEFGKTIRRYAEPFVKGGAVLFDVLSKYELDEVYIGDINAELINMYLTIRDCPELLINILNKYQQTYIYHYFIVYVFTAIINSIKVVRYARKSQELLNELLEKPLYVIDFLPQRVPNTGSGHFFDVEYYLLNSEKRHEMKSKYINIILKLMCCYRTSILWNGWKHHPKPTDIEAAISEIMENHSGTLNVLFPDEDVLLVFEWDCLNFSVYNLTEKMKEIVEKIALSESFFCWKGTD